MKNRILIIEDESIMRVTLEDTLKADGYDVDAFEKGMEAIEAFKGDDYSLVITDVRLPDINGLDITKRVKEIDQDVQVIIITAFGTIKDAVEAMKLGAFDYITKPFSLDEFKLIVERAIDLKEIKEDNVRLRKSLAECYCYPNIIGESKAIKKVFELIGKVSRSDSSVLILGESGTGKELIASTIHYQSPRKDKSLIKINCAALPESLIESELFGYEKGAFTGAVKRKPGRFELADGGTIFLDEVGELPPLIQVKLLRVLQDGTFERLGGTETLKVDVRVISATNRNLEDDIKSGRFREDLYYRLNVIPIHIPPLRERREDIPLLIEHFIGRSGKRIRFSPEAINALMRYDFPGNVRELENIVERCIALSEGKVIERHDLPQHILKEGQPEVLTLSEVSAEAEKEHILRVLRTTNNNKTKAAEILGISRKTLWEKMKAHDIKA
jgi:two-component system response regulator AtoC